MRRCAVWMSMVAVVLWAGASVLAQGQGKTDDKERGKERGPQASKAQENPPAANQAAEKNAGKGKAEDSGLKQGEPQGKKGGKAAPDSSEKGKGKGQGQQGKAHQNDQAKHMERQARLARIRELAVKKGDTEVVARVDKLIAKEKEVYDRKQGRLQGQPRATQTTGSDKAAKATAGPNDVGKGKSKAGASEPKSGKEAKPGEAKKK